MTNIHETSREEMSWTARARIREIAARRGIDPYTIGQLMILTDANIEQIGPLVKERDMYYEDIKKNPNLLLFINSTDDSNVLLNPVRSVLPTIAELHICNQFEQTIEQLREIFVSSSHQLGERWQDRISSTANLIFPSPRDLRTE